MSSKNGPGITPFCNWGSGGSVNRSKTPYMGETISEMGEIAPYMGEILTYTGEIPTYTGEIAHHLGQIPPLTSQIPLKQWNKKEKPLQK